MVSRKKCPSCKRDTWSEKNQQCSACGKGWEKVTPTVTASNRVTQYVTPEVGTLDVCSRCGCPGHEKAKSGAERQKAYRERKRNE